MGDGNQDSFVRNERFLNTRDQCLRMLAGPSKSTGGHEISGVLQVRSRKLIVSMADPRSNLLSNSLLMVTCLMQYWSMSSTSPSPRKTFWYKLCIREVRNPQPRRHTASCPQNGSYDTMNGGVCTTPTTPRTALPGPWNSGAVNGHIQGIHDINPPRGEDEAARDCGWMGTSRAEGDRPCLPLPTGDDPFLDIHSHTGSKKTEAPNSCTYCLGRPIKPKGCQKAHIARNGLVWHNTTGPRQHMHPPG